MNSFPSRKEIVPREEIKCIIRPTEVGTTANDCEHRLMLPTDDARDSCSMIGGSRREGCVLKVFFELRRNTRKPFHKDLFIRECGSSRPAVDEGTPGVAGLAAAVIADSLQCGQF